MKRWYFPSWNGDFRLIPATEHAELYRDVLDTPESACVLEVVDPTDLECVLLTQFLEELTRLDNDITIVKRVMPGTKRMDILLNTTIDYAGRRLVGHLKPSDRTITAVRSENGQLVVYDTPSLQSPPKAPKKRKTKRGEVADSAKPKVESDEPTALAKTGDAVAVSVARPTPSCPQCVPGAVSRASEVLLSFLSDEEHETWAEHRCLFVRGGLTGNRYLLAHRHSATAARVGRICFDIDDQIVLHFHDNSVPPEEEVLAAKLILEHREPWLRNEATCLTFLGIPVVSEGPHGLLIRNTAPVFKNPFGDISDGTVDAAISQRIGEFMFEFERTFRKD